MPLVPYKRIGLAVDAYRKLGFPLRIVGTGSGLRDLRHRAGPRTEFLGHRTDEEIRDLYRTCRLLVFPGEEDFGLVPVEAQACGTPVVAYAAGGVRETVVEGVTGLFFPEPTAESLADAVTRAAAHVWDPRRLRAQAERFGIQAFLDGLDQEIRGLLAD